MSLSKYVIKDYNSRMEGCKKFKLTSHSLPQHAQLVMPFHGQEVKGQARSRSLNSRNAP